MVTKSNKVRQMKERGGWDWVFDAQQEMIILLLWILSTRTDSTSASLLLARLSEQLCTNSSIKLPRIQIRIYHYETRINRQQRSVAGCFGGGA